MIQRIYEDNVLGKRSDSLLPFCVGREAGSAQEAVYDHSNDDQEDADQRDRRGNAVVEKEDAQQKGKDNLSRLGGLHHSQLCGIVLHQVGGFEKQDCGDDTGEQCH